MCTIKKLYAYNDKENAYEMPLISRRKSKITIRPGEVVFVKPDPLTEMLLLSGSRGPGYFVISSVSGSARDWLTETGDYHGGVGKPINYLSCSYFCCWTNRRSNSITLYSMKT